jgi:hypothetical protein
MMEISFPNHFPTRWFAGLTTSTRLLAVAQGYRADASSSMSSGKTGHDHPLSHATSTSTFPFRFAISKNATALITDKNVRLSAHRATNPDTLPTARIVGHGISP